jgi:hypothetical protein
MNFFRRALKAGFNRHSGYNLAPGLRRDDIIKKGVKIKKRQAVMT